VPTAVTYIGATLLFREKPLIYSGAHREYDFWRCRSRRDFGSSL
jgi:hypothetical protein